VLQALHELTVVVTEFVVVET